VLELSSMTIANELPVIDHNHNARMDATSPGLTTELFTMLAEELTDMQPIINECFANQNTSELGHHLHKLQGGCVYCGLPRLKIAAADLEKASKQGGHLDPTLLATFNQEVDAVFTEFKAKGIIKS